MALSPTSWSAVPQADFTATRPLRIWWNGLVANNDTARRVNDGLLTLPLEPMLHASRWRLHWIGLFTLVGHPLFGWIWGVWLPQPWESPWLRLAVALLGVPLLFNLWPSDLTDRAATSLFSLICWLHLPVFFSWMYLCNCGNTVWLASMVAMILVYHQLTDWRLASLGAATGGLAAWALFRVIGPASAPPIPDEQTLVNTVVMGFAWTTALGLAFSSANLRREQLNHTLATMGIMAHELRTPLATIALVGDALRGEAAQPSPTDGQSQKLDMLATRLHSLVRHMNHQIDTQIANARLLRLKHHAEIISAADVARHVVRDYPYRNARERASVTLEIRRDFIFDGSFSLFAQVLNNLLKNAFRSMAAAHTAPQPGDLCIIVTANGDTGTLLVRDRGVGIEPRLHKRIFEPFFSTSRGTGHGLGLAFCRRVLDDVHGHIGVTSEPGQGATFTLDIPRHHPS